ncbi:unnamed protein product, partial [Rotaria magnacalcarata]
VRINCIVGRDDFDFWS